MFCKVIKKEFYTQEAEDVYDISVENYHNFILANGSVVHNCDTYQSAQIQQQLIADGFDVTTISVDRLDSATKQCLPYAYLKSTIYDRRLSVYDKCDFLTEEVLGLERESDGHINHPEQGTQGCFTGDTKVSLVDGRECTLLELVDEYNNGKINYVYSFNTQTKKIEPKPIEKAWCTIKNASLVEVTLDNGEVLRCTPNHKFMLRDGTYCEAQNLVENDSLMPLYRRYPTEVKSMKNYRQYYEPIEDAWHYEHRQFAVEVDDEKYLVHHKNCKPNDNTPTNLIWCSKKRHQEIHAALSTGAHSIEAVKKRSASLSLYYQNNKNNPTFINRNKKISETLKSKTPIEIRLQKEQKSKAYKLKLENSQKKKQERLLKIKQIENTFNVVWEDLSVSERDGYAVKFARLQDPSIQNRISTAISKNHVNGQYENAYKALQECNQQNKKLKELCPEIDRDKFYSIFGFSYDSLDSKHKAPWATKYRKIVCKEILNHKVVSVKHLNYTEDVYDLTILDNHNFALSAGVFVHNSKDAIDAVCGSLWNASQHADEFAFEFGEEIEATISASTAGNEWDKKQIMLDFEEELKKITNDPLADFAEAKTKTDMDHFMNFGMGKASPLTTAYLPQGIIVF